MKKIYNSPKAQVVILRTTHVMATSGTPNVTVNPEGSVNANEVEVRRSGRSIWSEEW